MAEYIEREALIACIEERQDKYSDSELSFNDMSRGEYNGLELAKERISSAPTADVVPRGHSLWPRKIKLSPKRGGNGYVSSYSVNIGVNEAKACGFVLDGKSATLCKVIDSENGQIIIKLSKSADGGKDG